MNKLSVIGGCISSFEYPPNRLMMDKLWFVRYAYSINHALLNHATWNAKITIDMRKQVMEAWEHKPHLSVIHIGSVESKKNDIYPIYYESVEMLKKCGDVICIGILPSSLEWVQERREVHNPKIKRVCEELDCTYLDVTDIDPDVDTTDGIHINEKGHEKVWISLNRI